MIDVTPAARTILERTAHGLTVEVWTDPRGRFRMLYPQDDEETTELRAAGMTLQGAYGFGVSYADLEDNLTFLSRPIASVGEAA